mgnify:CR=1 FL=1
MARLGKRERAAFAAFKNNEGILEAQRQARIASEPQYSNVATNWQHIERIENWLPQSPKWEYNWKTARRINSGGKW